MKVEHLLAVVALGPFLLSTFVVNRLPTLWSKAHTKDADFGQVPSTFPPLYPASYVEADALNFCMAMLSYFI